MNLLQKKCLFVSAGVHGAMLLVLLIPPACSFTPEKPQSRVKIHLQSSASIEAVLRQQTLQTTPNPPTLEPVLVEPEPAKVKPPKPAPKPKPVPKPEISRKKPAPTPPKPRIEPKKPPQTKPKKPEIKIDFTKRVDRKLPPSQTAEEAQKQQWERAAAKAAQHQRKANRIIGGLLNQNLSGPSDVGELGGDTALKDWCRFVKESYERAWKWAKQAESSNSRSVAKAEVVINLDGSVASAQIVQSSGVAELDDSVRAVLARVRKIGKKPPAKTSTRDRTFTIAFNLKNGRINTE